MMAVAVDEWSTKLVTANKSPSEGQKKKLEQSNVSFLILMITEKRQIVVDSFKVEIQTVLI